MKILLTGAAGFIGYHLTLKLIESGESVVGLDNINNYYDPFLKKSRLKNIESNKNASCFSFINEDISNKESIEKIFKDNSFDIVINLAAQAGVRYSLENPSAYVDSNLVGFINILEGCRHFDIKHFIFASSSSVYGMNTKQPFSTLDRTDFPISLYAATKKSNELIAHSYSHLYGMPITGLRFFTVYGPFGRPDMAYYKFTRAILEGHPIQVYNNGKMKRDFTYIDDVIDGIVKVLEAIPEPQSNKHSLAKPPFKIYNIGNNNPVTLEEFIDAIETSLGTKAKRNLLPMQDGDVHETYANIDDMISDFNFNPSTSISEGIESFVQWYKSFHES